MDRIKCPKCEAPKIYTSVIRTSLEQAEELNYQCGSKLKVDGKTGKSTWVRECGHKIHNEFY